MSNFGIDTRWLRRATLALGLALAGSPLPSSTSIALAADEAEEEEEVRTGKGIKLRKFDEQANVSDEYARMAQQKRMESIERLKGLLSRGVADETKAEMMLRLADLYFQEGRYLYLREMAAFDQQFEACFNNDNCNTELLKPDNSGSRQWQEKSIKLYEGILRNYPRYQRADQATFFLGSAHKDIGREKDAVEAFKKLVKLYPQSTYIADAYVLIGEYYFDIEGNAYGALRAYLKATAYKDSPKYPFAMYKLGWCYYNVGDYEKAIETMKTVVSYSMAQGAEDKAQLQLQDEALKDLVRFFADADQMNEAIEYFTTLGRSDLIRTVLKRLAATFFEQGKFERAVEMYRRLILDKPTGTDNPEYQVEIIKAYKKLGQRDKVLEEVNKLRADYGPNSAWAQANASDPKAVLAAGESIEKELRRVAVDYHNTARQYEKSRHPDASKVYQLAGSAYATYLEIFPKNEHAYDVRYAYGELLYKTKDFQGAFEQYMAVVDMDPKGKHSQFCAESAIFSAEEQVKLEGGGAADGRVTAKANEAKEAQPLTEWEQRLVDACKKYADLFPTDKKVKNIIYKSAYLLYNKYRFDEAAAQFQSVIKMDPRSKEAEQAANLILDSLLIRKNWPALKENSKFYFDQEGLGSSQFKKDVYEIYQNASFKLIEINFEKDKDYGKAADGFMAFYEEFGSEAKVAAQALNNSAAYYSKSGRVADSMKVRHILVDDPAFGPKIKYYYDQIGFLGYDYEQIADYERAAYYYEQLWALYPEEKKKPENAEKAEEMDKKAGDAIYSAAVFRNGLGEWEKSIENFNAFVAGYPGDTRIPDIKIRVGKVYEENEKWEEAANVYQAFYKSPPADAPLEFVYFARLHYGQAMAKLGKIRDRDKVYAETVVLYNKFMSGGGAAGPHTEFVAEMMFTSLEPRLEDYLEKRINTGGASQRKQIDKNLEKSLSDKSKTLVEVEKEFTKVVETGAGEWGLASLVALGKAYENMAVSLRTSDKPNYLTDEQVEIYTMALEDKAYVQEEKSVNAFRLALEKSYELTLYNDNTAYATRRLGELRPDDFQGLSEQLLESRWTSSKAGSSYDYETSL